jgi:hypothetical protein
LNSNVYTHPLAPFGGAELSARLNTLLPELQKLTSATQAEVRFSNYTGLPHTFRFDRPEPAVSYDGNDYKEITADFVSKRSEALVGDKVTTADDKAESFGRTARLRQMVDGIPVYGGVLISSFDKDGRLTYVNNSFYPIPQEKRFGKRFLIGQQDAFEIAAEYVRVRFLHPLEGADGAPRPPLETSSGDAPNGDGKIIFPALISDGQVSPEAALTLEPQARQEAAYLPAWLVTVREPATGRAWSVVVDAERTEGPLERRILAASENLRGTSVRSEVTTTVLAALGKVLPKRTLVKLADTPSGDLSDAPSFELRVARRVGGAVNYVAASVNGGDPNAPRFANTYFHLTKALEQFTEIVNDAWPDTPANRPQLPGQANRLPVRFELEELPGSEFTWDTRMLRFGRGKTTSSFPYGDPTSDPDVLYHEYTHAVLDIVQHDLHMQHKTQFHVAIDEGLAFYYACSLTDRITRDLAPNQVGKLIPYRWGKVSHQTSAWTAKGYRDLERAAQVADHDFFQVYGVFPAYSRLDDPDSGQYACGMVCARMLWDVRRVLGPALADAIILRATHLAGGVQSDVETLAEAIIHVDREMAADAGRASHESALRLVFSSRGILADSPVNELRTVSFNGQQLILAATENTDASGSQSGCLFSSDGGLSWVPLGIGGPGEVVAVATLEAGQNHVIIWAATEAQAGQAGQPPQQLVYRYDLMTNAAGAPVTGGTWSALPPLGIKAGILAMTGMTSADGTPWLFVGTEGGIYKFDGTGWPAPAAAGQLPAPNWDANMPMPVFDLAAVTLAGSHKLLAATNDGPRVLKINEPTTNTAAALTLDQAFMFPKWLLDLDLFPTLALTIGTDGAGQGHLFAGTSDRGLYHWDPVLPAPGWTRMPTAGMVPGDPTKARPIFCVLPTWLTNGGWEITVGTDNGVYRKTGNGGWTSANSAESVENTSVVAMCQAGTTLLAGTGQHGLWRQEQTGQWLRVTQGLPRLGRLNDALINGRFTGVLVGQDTGTHVLLVSQTQPALSLETEVDAGGSVDQLKLFYVAPYVDLTQGHLAGLQAVTLTPAGSTKHTAPGAIKPGFYLVVVRAGAQGATYRVKIDFQL